jgi:uncharacterized protein YbcI
MWGATVFLPNTVTMTRMETSAIMTMTKGQMEAEISKALVSFEREYMGRGPVEAKTYIIRDMLLIRLKGVLTLAEKQLAKDEDGIQLVKQVRTRLLEKSQEVLGSLITDVIGCQIQSFHTDISTRTGERFIIITLLEDLEERFPVRKN